MEPNNLFYPSLKMIPPLILVILLSNYSLLSQDFSLQFDGLAGATIVDVEDATGQTLEDWSLFSFGIIGTGKKQITEKLNAGLELGYQRLYYYEYLYDYPGQVGYSPFTRYGSIYTLHFGPVVEYLLNMFYLKGGLNLRVFTDGSGVTTGIMLGTGLKFNVSENAYIPLGARSDIVFGDATPVPVSLNTGLCIEI